MLNKAHYFAILLAFLLSGCDEETIAPAISNSCESSTLIKQEKIHKAKITVQSQQIENLFHENEKLQQAWNKYLATNDQIKRWSLTQQHILDLDVSDTIVYPCGGADVVFPISFFPNFKELVIIGLEPVGKNFNLENKEGIVTNLTYLFNHGNFVTRDMEQFKKSGVFTVILAQLYKIGATEISYKTTNNSVDFDFILNNQSRKVRYIRMNLHNNNHEAWASFFEYYKNFTLYMKSASFVPQQEGFEKLRDALIANSSVIFQDDTGIEYKKLIKNDFKVKLYGSYYLRYTIKGLERFFQDDLKEVYNQTQPQTLPFAIGYRSDTVPGNMLIAYKASK